MKKNKIILNFFDKENIISSISNLYNINYANLKEYLIDFQYDEQHFIKKFNINLNTNLDNVEIVLKHGMSSIDDFMYFKKYGFKLLRELVGEKSSPISIFLKKNNIVFDIEKCNISINNKIFEINKIDDFLETRLYKQSEVEFFYKGTDEDINNYSCINTAPEFMQYFDTNVRTNLVTMWGKYSKFKIITIQIPVNYLGNNWNLEELNGFIVSSVVDSRMHTFVDNKHIHKIKISPFVI